MIYEGLYEFDSMQRAGAVGTVCGVDEAGILDTNDATAGVARTMIEHAHLAVMLADHSKFRAAGMARLVPWGAVDILVTGACPENLPMLETIRKQGVKIITVPCEEGGAR